MHESEKLTLRMAVELLGLDADTSKSNANVACPICARHSRERKLNLNFDKEDGGVFHCVKCDIAGRPLHLWALYRNLSTNDMKAVANDYYNFRSGNPEQVRKATTLNHIPVKVDEPIADIATRDKTYRGLLSMLTLSNAHMNNLEQRGLTKEAIHANMYRTYPSAGWTDIAELLLSKGYVLRGVPGFYTKNGRWTLLRLRSGFLIPQLDGYGRIQGLQIRMDNSNANGTRYFTVSTGGDYENGAKGATYCHMRYGNRGLNEIILTEGPLKADIISAFTGYTCLAIPGVNSLSYMYRALYDLKNAGCRCISIALDMDKLDNPYVLKAQEKIINIICSLGLNYKVVSWEEDYHSANVKGLDDWLLRMMKNSSVKK